MAMRYLTDKEISLAYKVFLTSLPWYKIRVTDRLGFDSAQYTIGRTMNVGPYMYSGLDAAADGPSTLIHELTHIWQSEHRGYRAAYIFDSVLAQALAEEWVRTITQRLD